MPAGGPGRKGGRIKGPIGRAGPKVKGWGRGEAVDMGPGKLTGDGLSHIGGAWVIVGQVENDSIVVLKI